MVVQGLLPGLSSELVTGIPDQLKDLQLYAKDKRLCREWHELEKEWRKAWPKKDFMVGVLEAHRWEVANPARRKRDRPRFLNNWLSGWSKRPEVERGRLPDKDSFRTEREQWFQSTDQDGQTPNARAS